MPFHHAAFMPLDVSSSFHPRLMSIPPIMEPPRSLEENVNVLFFPHCSTSSPTGSVSSSSPACARYYDETLNTVQARIRAPHSDYTWDYKGLPVQSLGQWSKCSSYTNEWDIHDTLDVCSYNMTMVRTFYRSEPNKPADCSGHPVTVNVDGLCTGNGQCTEVYGIPITTMTYTANFDKVTVSTDYKDIVDSSNWNGPPEQPFVVGFRVTPTKMAIKQYDLTAYQLSSTVRASYYPTNCVGVVPGAPAANMLNKRCGDAWRGDLLANAGGSFITSLAVHSMQGLGKIVFAGLFPVAPTSSLPPVLQWYKVYYKSLQYGSMEPSPPMFDSMFALSPHSIVYRECTSCDPSHQHIYYKRITPLPASVSIRSLMLNTWTHDSNLLNVDFELYSSYADALAGTNRWTYCNYDDAGVGFPRDCGPSGPVSFNWNSVAPQWMASSQTDYDFYIELYIPAPLPATSITTLEAALTLASSDQPTTLLATQQYFRGIKVLKILSSAAPSATPAQWTYVDKCDGLMNRPCTSSRIGSELCMYCQLTDLSVSSRHLNLFDVTPISRTRDFDTLPATLSDVLSSFAYGVTTTVKESLFNSVVSDSTLYPVGDAQAWTNLKGATINVRPEWNPNGLVKSIVYEEDEHGKHWINVIINVPLNRLSDATMKDNTMSVTVKAAPVNDVNGVTKYTFDLTWVGVYPDVEKAVISSQQMVTFEMNAQQTVISTISSSVDTTATYKGSNLFFPIIQSNSAQTPPLCHGVPAPAPTCASKTLTWTLKHKKPQQNTNPDFQEFLGILRAEGSVRGVPVGSPATTFLPGTTDDVFASGGCYGFPAKVSKTMWMSRTLNPDYLLTVQRGNSFYPPCEVGVVYIGPASTSDPQTRTRRVMCSLCASCHTNPNKEACERRLPDACFVSTLMGGQAGLPVELGFPICLPEDAYCTQTVSIRTDCNDLASPASSVVDNHSNVYSTKCPKNPEAALTFSGLFEWQFNVSTCLAKTANNVPVLETCYTENEALPDLASILERLVVPLPTVEQIPDFPIDLVFFGETKHKWDANLMLQRGVGLLPSSTNPETGLARFYSTGYITVGLRFHSESIYKSIPLSIVRVSVCRMPAKNVLAFTRKQKAGKYGTPGSCVHESNIDEFGVSGSQTFLSEAKDTMACERSSASGACFLAELLPPSSTKTVVPTPINPFKGCDSTWRGCDQFALLGATVIKEVGVSGLNVKNSPYYVHIFEIDSLVGIVQDTKSGGANRLRHMDKTHRNLKTYRSWSVSSHDPTSQPAAIASCVIDSVDTPTSTPTPTLTSTPTTTTTTTTTPTTTKTPFTTRPPRPTRTRRPTTVAPETEDPTTDPVETDPPVIIITHRPTHRPTRAPRTRRPTTIVPSTHEHKEEEQEEEQEKEQDSSNNHHDSQTVVIVNNNNEASNTNNNANNNDNNNNNHHQPNNQHHDNTNPNSNTEEHEGVINQINIHISDGEEGSVNADGIVIAPGLPRPGSHHHSYDDSRDTSVSNNKKDSSIWVPIIWIVCILLVVFIGVGCVVCILRYMKRRPRKTVHFDGDVTTDEEEDASTDAANRRNNNNNNNSSLERPFIPSATTTTPTHSPPSYFSGMFSSPQPHPPPSWGFNQESIEISNSSDDGLRARHVTVNGDELKLDAFSL